MKNTLLVTASEYRFISENGIVEVLGDKNQLVNAGIRKINRPLSFERGCTDKIRGSDAYCRDVDFPAGMALKYRPLLRSQSPIDNLVNTLNQTCTYPIFPVLNSCVRYAPIAT